MSGDVVVRDVPPAGRTARLVSRGRSAVRQYGWLLLDQAVFASTNLILNILFAHWLTPTDYGRFGVSFSGFILLSVLHWYVVVEPLLVVSTRLGVDQTRPYIATLIQAHALLIGGAAAVAVAAIVVGKAWDAEELGWTVAAAAGCGCPILALATARRLCLAFLSASVSATIGLCYLGAATMSAWLLHAAGIISWLALWMVMSAWSLVCAGAIAAMLLRRTQGTERYRLGDLLRATSRFVAWGSTSACFSWIRSDGIYAVLAATAGLPAVAQTRAVVTLNAPVPQINSALNASWLVDFGHRRGTSRIRETVIRRVAAYVGLSIPAVLIAWRLGGWVAHVVYRGKYDEAAVLIPLFLLAYLCNGIEGMLTSAMKASGILRDAYLPQIAGSISVGVVALIAIPRAGPTGAAMAVLAGATIGLGCAAILFQRMGRGHA